MRRITVIVLVVLWLPVLAAIIWGYAAFHDLAWRGSPPEWGDGLNLLTTVAAFISIAFLYLQIRDQQDKDELARINAQLDGIPALVETLKFGQESGVEAIVSYGIKYNYKTSPHPRIQIDKIQYAITLLRLVFIDLTRLKNKKAAVRTMQKACLLFYSHFYFTVSYVDTQGNGLLPNLEPPYKPFKSQFEDMQQLSYALLIHWNLVGAHKESEVNRPVKAVVENQILSVYRYFVGIRI